MLAGKSIHTNQTGRRPLEWIFAELILHLRPAKRIFLSPFYLLPMDILSLDDLSSMNSIILTLVAMSPLFYLYPYSWRDGYLTNKQPY